MFNSMKTTTRVLTINDNKYYQNVAGDVFCLDKNSDNMVLNSAGTSIIGAWPHLSTKYNSLFGISR